MILISPSLYRYICEEFTLEFFYMNIVCWVLQNDINSFVYSFTQFFTRFCIKLSSIVMKSDLIHASVFPMICMSLVYQIANQHQLV